MEIDGVIKTRIENFGYGLPNLAQYLRTWGEAGTIKTGKVGKTGNHGAACMFIGYANNHEGNCYWMWNTVSPWVLIKKVRIGHKRMDTNSRLLLAQNATLVDYCTL